MASPEVMPSLPPEIITWILAQLSPASAASIPTLISASLASHSFSSLALHSSLWAPHASHRWKLALPLPTKEGEDAFEYYKRRSILDRRAVKLVQEMSRAKAGNIGRLEEVREMGEDVGDKLEQVRGGGEHDEEFWLSGRYWAGEAAGVLKRMKAVEVWKRIMTEEADESEHRDASFEEGIGAFVAYRGDSTNELQHHYDLLAASIEGSDRPPNDRLAALKSTVLQVTRCMKGAGYKAATSSTFHHLDNHFLSSVHRQAVSVDQESNTGTLPLSLVSIFCSIINRLDPAFNIRARPVGFPGIVLAAVANRTEVVGEEQWHFINLFVSGDILSPSELRSFAALAGLERSMDVEVFRPASARDMCIRAARNIIQSVRTEDSANPTPALYAAAMALFILSPPSPVTAYANWIVGICQADYESDVGVIERDVLPALPPAERTNIGLITQVIRDVDDTVPTLKEGLDLKWKPGHVFRHRLFSYVAVIRAWDMTCEASENWIQQMQVDRLQHGRHQPFYHVLVDDQTSRYVAHENVTEDHSVTARDLTRLTNHPSVGRYFRKTSTDSAGRRSLIVSAQLQCTYGGGTSVFGLGPHAVE